MSKPIKNLITESYRQRFNKLEGAVVIDVRGIKSNENNRIRNELAQKQVRVTVVKNSLAKKAFEGTGIAELSKLIEGSSAVVYGGESVVSIARQLMGMAKEIETLRFKGALMDGQIWPAEKFEELSKLPTKKEAQAQIVTLIFSPAKKLAGQILGPGSKVASLIKAIEEKKAKEAPAAAPAA